MSTQKRGLVIAIAGGKGGPGKTTITVNVAIDIAHLGARVAIFDADKQRSAAKFIERRNTLRRSRPDLPAVDCIEKLGDIKPDIISASQKYDVVIIDTAGRDSQELRYALSSADIVYIPVQPSMLDLETLEELEPTLQKTHDSNPNRVVRAFVTMAPTNVHSQDKVKAARDYIETFDLLKSTHRHTCRREAYKTTMNKGLGVVEFRDSKAKAEIKNLTQEIINHG